MKRLLTILLVVVTTLAAHARKQSISSNYAVLASASVQQDSEWNKVAIDLAQRHGAELIYFGSHPEECEQKLRGLAPRYVAIVEQPQNINDKYIMRIARLSRRMDDDIFADWLWGIITGYDAESAGRMVTNSVEPLVIHNCVSDIKELESAKWFDNYAWVDDHEKAKAGEKHGFYSKVKTYQFDFDDELNILSRFIYDINPDLIVTATHANYGLLTVPFMPTQKSLFVSDKGVIWKQFNRKNVEPLRFTGKRNVYFPVGNCLIGGMNNDRNSMPPAWIKSANSAAMAGYVVPTWYGRNGWGGLKYWLTTPGRYTLPQAIYLNQQDMMEQMNRWDKRFDKLNYPFGEADSVSQTDYTESEFALATKRIKEQTSINEVTNDMIGFLYDRDVLAYYGDPLWNVRLQTLENEQDYTVTQKKSGNIITLTIKTKQNFSLVRLKGNHFKDEHVLDLPFSYFFPERIKHPAIVEGQTWDAVVDENFLLIYNPDFKPNSTYQIKIRINC